MQESGPGPAFAASRELTGSSELACIGRRCQALPAPGGGAFQIIVADLERDIHSCEVQGESKAAFSPRASVVLYQNAGMVRYAEGLLKGAFPVSPELNSALLNL